MAIAFQQSTASLYATGSEFYRTFNVRHVFADCISGSWVYEEPIQKIAAEFRSIREDCSVPGWDGGSALPISQKALNVAKRVAACLPREFPIADVVPEADGEVSFDWYKAPNLHFSFSVGESGVISFAGRIGNERFHGNTSFFGNLPDIVNSSISRIYGLSIPIVS
jgi:hypothetical protein